VKLYGYWRSSCSWRVRIALEYKGLEYRMEPVHLARGPGEQNSPGYRSVNPMSQVPVLETEDGMLLSQSLAIIEFLEELEPAPTLLPGCRRERARARQMAELVNAGIQPLQNLSLLQKIEAMGGSRTAWAEKRITEGLGALENLVQQVGGEFMAGGSPSIADCCMVPQLYNARRFGVQLEAFPRLLRIENRCTRIGAFQAAHPDMQPDAVPYTGIAVKTLGT
jgi:maleylpyruvate isomerase